MLFKLLLLFLDICFIFCPGVTLIYVVFGISFNFITLSFRLRLVIGLTKYDFFVCLLREEGRFSIPKLDELLVILRKPFPFKFELINFLGNFSKSKALIDILCCKLSFCSKFNFFLFIFIFN